MLNRLIYMTILTSMFLSACTEVVAKSKKEKDSDVQNATTQIEEKKSAVQDRFFMHGDGHLVIRGVSGQNLDVYYRKDDGSLDDEAFAKIDATFGFPTNMMGENISRRMLGMLDYFSDLVAPGKTIVMASGYRSQSYNNQLRKAGRTAAKTSTHIDGMAIDFSIPGVDGKEFWELIRHRDCCGAGNYGGNVVHLDSGRPRFWEKATSKVNTGASDFNRYIYLSTEYDRYQMGERARLLFTSISDFGFGVKPDFDFVSDKEGENKMDSGRLEAEDSRMKDGCLMINERKDARFIYAKIPDGMKAGKYRVRFDFCNKPFTEMPDKTVSNEIEILR